MLRQKFRRSCELGQIRHVVLWPVLMKFARMIAEEMRLPADVLHIEADQNDSSTAKHQGEIDCLKP